MTNKIYLASSNEHKKKEFSRLLLGWNITLPKEEGIDFDVDENGSSFIDNAILKAKLLYSVTHTPVLSDDSGLCVRALGWKPGIYTARYGENDGKTLTSKEKYTLLLKNMEGIHDRYALFVSCVVLIINEYEIYIAECNTEGEIALSPSGENGFGYDPVFYSYEKKAIIATLPESEKDEVSHRGRAVRKIKKFLDDLIDK